MLVAREAIEAMRNVSEVIRGALGLLIAALVLFGTYGYFNSFVPSKLTVTITAWSALVMGLLSAGLFGAFGGVQRHQGKRLSSRKVGPVLPIKGRSYRKTDLCAPSSWASGHSL